MRVLPIRYCADVEATTRFYRALGLEIGSATRTGGWVELPAATGALALHRSDADAGECELAFEADEPLEAVAARVGGEFGISQPAVSQHLKVLRDNGFATVRAEGTRRLYAVDPSGLQEVDAWVEQFRVFWDQKLDALGTEIARGKKGRVGAS